MKRLRDERGASDPLLAAAARLVAAREPLAEDAARRQRVRARMRRRRSAPGAAWLRVAAVVLLVFSVAAASAMIGRVAQTIRARIVESRAAKQRERERTRAHHATPPTASMASPAPTPPIARWHRPTAPIAADRTNGSDGARCERHRRPPIEIGPRGAVSAPLSLLGAIAAPAAPRDAAAAASSPPRGRCRRLIARAKKRASSPTPCAPCATSTIPRASPRLGRYLDRYPDGVAAEDALALALEATIGRDAPRAAGFATRYLARYPSGRWSSLARRALEP